LVEVKEVKDVDKFREEVEEEIAKELGVNRRALPVHIHVKRLKASQT